MVERMASWGYAKADTQRMTDAGLGSFAGIPGDEVCDWKARLPS